MISVAGVRLSFFDPSISNGKISARSIILKIPEALGGRVVTDLKAENVYLTPNKLYIGQADFETYIETSIFSINAKIKLNHDQYGDYIFSGYGWL